MINILALNDELALPPPDEYLKKSKRLFVVRTTSNNLIYLGKFIDAEAIAPPSIFRDESNYNQLLIYQITNIFFLEIYDEFSMTPPNVFLKKSNNFFNCFYLYSIMFYCILGKRVESDEFIPQSNK